MLGFILFPLSHQLLRRCRSSKPLGPGRQRAGPGRQPLLICQSCLRAASPPCSYATLGCSSAPRGAGSVPEPRCAAHPYGLPWGN